MPRGEVCSLTNTVHDAGDFSARVQASMGRREGRADDGSRSKTLVLHNYRLAAAQPEYKILLTRVNFRSIKIMTPRMSRRPRLK
jgi:hypothetical protein